MENKIKQILNEFTNFEKKQEVDNYINFCVKNSCENNFKHRHHILPKIFFPEYKNLEQHIWNCAKLTDKTHIEAHKLFCKISDDYRMKYAVISLNKLKDCDEFKKIELWKEWANQISENGKTNIQNTLEKSRKTKIDNGIYDNWGLKMSQYLNTIQYIDGELLSNAQIINRKAIETKKNIICGNGLSIWDNTILKIQEAMKQIESNGKTKQQNTTAKILKTKELTIDSDGLNIHQQIGQKNKELMAKTIILEDGTVTTIGKTRFNKAIKKLNEKLMSDEKTHDWFGEKITFSEYRKRKVSFGKSKKFFKIHKINDTDKRIYSSGEIKHMGVALFKTSKESPLGSNQRTKTKYINKNKEYMIGWYIEEVSKPNI